MNPLLEPALMEAHGPGKLADWCHRVILVLLAVTWLAVVLQQVPRPTFLAATDWLDAVLLVVALVATVSTYARQISLQSALMAAVVIGLIGGGAHWLSGLTGIPFGPVQFPKTVGLSPFQEAFCAMAGLWVILLLTARGVARLVLLPWAKRSNHGLFLLSLSIVLLLLMVMAMEPFASAVHRYWLWGDTRLPVSWQRIPLSSLLAWCVIGIIASMAATPFLINKRPRPPVPAWEPAGLWMLLSGLFGLGTAFHDLWQATAVAVINAVIGAYGLVVAARQRSTSP